MAQAILTFWWENSQIIPLKCKHVGFVIEVHAASCGDTDEGLRKCLEAALRVTVGIP